ncbi:hypothetical protein [Kibdelosporangium philippinense]|uniref:hypothetical protein n=1 Tax=Kibdelosporangium philippinense TaxID=211113 RepID=UPI00361C00EC
MTTRGASIGSPFVTLTVECAEVFASGPGALPISGLSPLSARARGPNRGRRPAAVSGVQPSEEEA